MPPRRSGTAATGGANLRVATVEAATEQRAPLIPLSDDEVEATMPFKVISQFKTCKDIRFEVWGDYWEKLPALRGKKLTGVFNQWTKKERPGYAVSATWEDGRDVEHLDLLFHPENFIGFLNYEETASPHHGW